MICRTGPGLTGFIDPGQDDESIAATSQELFGCRLGWYSLGNGSLLETFIVTSQFGFDKAAGATDRLVITIIPLVRMRIEGTDNLGTKNSWYLVYRSWKGMKSASMVLIQVLENM